MNKITLHCYNYVNPEDCKTRCPTLYEKCEVLLAKGTEQNKIKSKEITEKLNDLQKVIQILSPSDYTNLEQTFWEIAGGYK